MNGIFSKEKTVNKVVMIDVSQIMPNPAQPRRIFDEAELSGLGQSIKTNGVLQPLSVRVNKNGKYELVAGERRLRAIKLAGMTEAPCIIVETDERQSAIFALLENLQRKDLSFFEEAKGLEVLINRWGVTQDEAAKRLGKAQSTIANKMRLLRLSEKERVQIERAGLTERHARALLRISDEKEREKALLKIIKEGYNIPQCDDYIEKLTNRKKDNNTGKTVYIIKDIRLFINTITHALSVMKKSGINSETQRTDTDEYIEYVIKIPLNNRASKTA